MEFSDEAVMAPEHWAKEYEHKLKLEQDALVKPAKKKNEEIRKTSASLRLSDHANIKIWDGL